MKRAWDLDVDEDQVPRRVRERRALKALDLVFRKADEAVSRTHCPNSGDCCQFATSGRVPNLLPLEQVRLDRALSAAGRRWPQARPDGACALLDETGRRCSVYGDRPFGCRTFFCARGGGRSAPSAVIHALSAQLVAASDELEPGAQPVALDRLFAARREQE